MVVMIGSREAKEDLEARSVGRRRKEGRKGGGVKEGKKQREVDEGHIKGRGEERGGKGKGSKREEGVGRSENQVCTFGSLSRFVISDIAYRDVCLLFYPTMLYVI